MTEKSLKELKQEIQKRKDMKKFLGVLSDLEKSLVEIRKEIKGKKDPVDKVKIANFPKQKDSLKIENLSEIEIPEEVKVSNLKDIKIPDHPEIIKVEKPKWFSLKGVMEGLKEIKQSVINIQMPDFEKYTKKKNALAVRLVDKDGNQYYTAGGGGGQSGGLMGIVQRLINGTQKTQVVDSNGLVWDMDASRSGKTIQNAHAKIHEGDHYFVRDYEDEGNGGVIEFVITVPANVTPHVKFTIDSLLGFSVDVYEGTTGVTGGTSTTPINNKRSSSNTSALTILKDPASISSDGAKILGILSGSNKSSGSIQTTDEINFKESTSYLFRITSLDANNTISYYGNWYEV